RGDMSPQVKSANADARSKGPARQEPRADVLNAPPTGPGKMRVRAGYGRAGRLFDAQDPLPRIGNHPGIPWWVPYDFHVGFFNSRHFHQLMLGISGDSAAHAAA